MTRRAQKLYNVKGLAVPAATRTTTWLDQDKDLPRCRSQLGKEGPDITLHTHTAEGRQSWHHPWAENCRYLLLPNPFPCSEGSPLPQL